VHRYLVDPDEVTAYTDLQASPAADSCSPSARPPQRVTRASSGARAPSAKGESNTARMDEGQPGPLVHDRPGNRSQIRAGARRGTFISSMFPTRR
jgi:hypothetical protein